MMSATLSLSHQRRASSRLSIFSPQSMHLALPFHPEWTTKHGTEAALAELHAAGVTALELNLPPALGPADRPLWHNVVDLAQPHFTLHLHAPLLPASPGWPLVFELMDKLVASQTVAPFLVVHAPPAARDHADNAAVSHWVATVLARLPHPAQLAIELGWNWGTSMGLAARWQRWRQSTTRTTVGGRPQGVGSGLGTAISRPLPNGRDEPVDSPLHRPSSFWRPRAAGWSAAGTRAAVLSIVNAVDDPRVWIGWDLAHDWLGGPWSGDATWTTIPDSQFFSRVGYVRLHDVADDGTDHLPLVVGNVPYTTQLRSLRRTTFDGPVCLAVRHTNTAARLGTRSELRAKSLAVARQALKLE